MGFRRSIALVSLSSLVSVLASACGDDAGGSMSDRGGGGDAGAAQGGATADGAGPDTSASTATSGEGASTSHATGTSTSSGEATGGNGPVGSTSGGGEGGSGGDGGGPLDGGGSDPGCPEGYAGVDCTACAVGYQDDDANGTCLPGCDAEGDLALDCGDFGACDVAMETGERACACDEGHAGADCSTCAPGYVQDAPGTGCELDLPSTTMLRLWLDADTQSFGLAENNRVASWEDRRGEVIASLAAPASQAQPLYVGGALGGRPVVRFEGNDVLRTVDLSAMQGADYTILAVLEVGTQQGNVVSREHVEFPLGARLRRNGTSFTLRHEAPNGDEDSVAVSGLGSVARVVAAVRQTSPILKLLRVTVRVDGDPLAVDAFTPAVAGDLGNMGGRFVVGDGLVGDVAELLVYDRALELDEVVRVQQYLAAKYHLE